DDVCSHVGGLWVWGGLGLGLWGVGLWARALESGLWSLGFGVWALESGLWSLGDDRNGPH
ncbi:MAG: hypothetical protein HC771_20000, partial [Synechococcales cyanobacterium CRU_2_2]|nr:hypothetical protein [Synechococcales cyanobacterium CRU_2_2]